MAEMPAEIATKLQDLPQPVVVGLSSFVDSALAICGTTLKSVVLYGSGAEGRLRAASDVGPYAAAQAAIGLRRRFYWKMKLDKPSRVHQPWSDFSPLFTSIRKPVRASLPIHAGRQHAPACRRISVGRWRPLIEWAWKWPLEVMRASVELRRL
jgi:hypothetical protein